MRCGAVLPSARPWAHAAKLFFNNCEGTPAKVCPRPPRYQHAQTDAPLRMIDYAHTAEQPAGKRRPESSGKAQPLRTHLENVAALAVLPLIQSSPWITPPSSPPLPTRITSQTRLLRKRMPTPFSGLGLMRAGVG